MKPKYKKGFLIIGVLQRPSFIRQVGLRRYLFTNFKYEWYDEDINCVDKNNNIILYTDIFYDT